MTELVLAIGLAILATSFLFHLWTHRREERANRWRSFR